MVRQPKRYPPYIADKYATFKEEKRILKDLEVLAHTIVFKCKTYNSVQLNLLFWKLGKINRIRKIVLRISFSGNIFSEIYKIWNLKLRKSVGNQFC